MNGIPATARPVDGPDAPDRVARSITLDCDLDRAWALIATEEGLGRWLGTGLRLDPDIGGAVELVDDEGCRRVGRVLAAEPGRSLTFAWAPEGDEGSRSTVTLAVEADETGGSRVAVVEERAGGMVASCADAGAAWDRRLVGLELDVAIAGPLARHSALVAA